VLTFQRITRDNRVKLSRPAWNVFTEGRKIPVRVTNREGRKIGCFSV
jgi:hypothetical protein